MRSGFGFFIIVTLMLLLDLYFFQVIKALSKNYNPATRQIMMGLFLLLALVSFVGFILFFSTNPQMMSRRVRSYILAISMGFFFAELVGVLFFLVDDMRRLMQWIAGKFFYRRTGLEDIAENKISRSQFLSWLGFAASGALFGSLVMGFRNKYNYSVRNINLNFPNLPAAFKGLRIVQISDIHSGSLLNVKGVEKGIHEIMQLKPDLIVVTGDLVNDMAVEIEPLKHLLSRLKAPMGVYSVLGNHDYGDYTQWPVNGISKTQNLIKLKNVQAEMGWKLLMNEHVKFEKQGEQIALIGVENWGNRARFPKYGRLKEAYSGTENIPFKILLSHDPSHWDAQVVPEFSSIDLTLSGHTHGMQFGVEIPGLKWSPVQYVYKQWAGLYEEGSQKLYVNRGFGFIGYPGRVGILPEITLFTLT